MNIKIIVHLMPWELDYANLMFNQLAIAKKYTNPEDTIYVHSCLNLSGYIINWEESKMPKQYYIDKYNNLCGLLHEYNNLKFIYDGNEIYGHLDFERVILQENIDYYIHTCPDMYFGPHILFYLIESAKQIKDKYFIITPEISKVWDSTWDELVNENFKSIKYEDWSKQELQNIIYISDVSKDDEVHVEKITKFKWAGWFDLYNKAYFEKFLYRFDSWKGYGAIDYHGMVIASNAKKLYKTNIEQYILRNQIIFDRNIGVNRNTPISSIDKSYLKLNDIPNQRAAFDSRFDEYLNGWHEYAKENKIL